MDIDLKDIKDCGPYFGFLLSFFLTKKKFLCVIISFLALTLSYQFYFSNKAQTKLFRKDVNNTLKSNQSIEFRNIVDNSVVHFSGKDINISLFWKQLLYVDLQLANKYKKDISIYTVVVNDSPSSAFQLSGNDEKDAELKQYSKTVPNIEIEKRFQIIKDRKNLFDQNPRITHLSIYCKDGINQEQFELNIKNSNGKINGLKTECNLITKRLKGQFTIIKNNKNGMLLLFIEYNGEQFFNQHTVISKTNKTLSYRYFYNKHQINNFDKDLYNLLYSSKILDIL